MMRRKAKYPKGYIFATALFVFITIIFLILCNVVYNNGRQIYRHGFTEVNAAYTIRASLASISNRFQAIRLVAEQKYDSDEERSRKIAEQTKESAPKIQEELGKLRYAMESLKSISDLSEEDQRNIKELDDAVTHMIEVANDTLNRGKAESNITPEDVGTKAVQQSKEDGQTSTIMAEAQGNTFAALEKALGRWRAETEVELASSQKFHIISNWMMIAVMTIVSISIITLGLGIMRKENEVLQQREVAEYQESRAEKAKAKTEEIAYMNLIMDCGNRYALTETVNTELKEEKEFAVARFELTDFKSILSMIGYERIDKYMAEAANQIRSAFEKDGRLFTTTGEDFIFVFDEEVLETEVTEKAELIRKRIGDILVDCVNIGSSVTGVVVYSKNFKGKSADALLTAMQSAGAQPGKAGKLVFT